MLSVRAGAQVSFEEGEIVYHVALTTADNYTIKGIYVFSIKNRQIRKELTMDNGYKDITLINAARGTLYSLQERDGHKYAIQLDMENDLLKKQTRFKGLIVTKEEPCAHPLAGQKCYKGTVMYKDSTTTEIIYTKAWKPDVPSTWNRFPDAPFIPLMFSYKEENGVSMVFTAERIEAVPVHTSLFSIPQGYKMISNTEYLQLKR